MVKTTQKQTQTTTPTPKPTSTSTWTLKYRGEQSGKKLRRWQHENCQNLTKLFRASPLRDAPTPRRRRRSRSSSATWGRIHSCRRFLGEVTVPWLLLLVQNNSTFFPTCSLEKRPWADNRPSRRLRRMSLKLILSFYGWERCACVIFCSINICGDVGDAFEVEKKHVLPRAPGVECSMLRFWVDTANISISPFVNMDFFFTVKYFPPYIFLIFQKLFPSNLYWIHVIKIWGQSSPWLL